MTVVDILVNPEHVDRMKAVYLMDIDEYLILSRACVCSFT